MASKTLESVWWALPNLPRPMSQSFSSAIACLQGWKRLEPGSFRPSAPRVLALLVARWLAEHHQKLFETYMRPSGRTSAASANQRNSWSPGQVVTIHPSERAGAARQNRRVRHQRLAGPGTPTVPVSRSAVAQRLTRRTTAPLSLLVHASDNGNGKRVEAAPLSTAADHAVMPSDTEARAKTVLSTPEAWKKCRNADDGRASTVCDATKNMLACPELVRQGPALERDLERLSKRL